LLAFFDRDPGTGIGHREDGPIGALHNRNPHFGSTAAVLDRIVDEIGDSVEQQIPETLSVEIATRSYDDIRCLPFG
jgi:hypothetical protein